ncbi:hypothetical protein [Tautonia marina]|uniref:hypothetical protein n=1 Tax=Tautonia marina TaxID=2653855 RepID=UPI001260B07E|nr:hypothetical protein [Tautonia marina]
MMTTALLITSVLLPAAAGAPPDAAAARAPGQAIPDGHFRVHSSDFGRTAHLALIELQLDIPAGMTLLVEDFGNGSMRRPVPEGGDRPFHREHFAAVVDRFGVFRSGGDFGRMPGESCWFATKTDSSSGVSQVRDVPHHLPLEQMFEGFLEPGDYPVGPPLEVFRFRDQTCTIRVVPNAEAPAAPRPAPRRPGADFLGCLNPAAHP